jgi:quinol monooxygenase YgiN
MHALIGRVEIKPDRADEALSMIDGGVAMLKTMPGCAGGYWARTVEGDLIQHSFWLFDTEANARSAQTIFRTLRDMPDAPATYVSADVCEVIGET